MHPGFPIAPEPAIDLLSGAMAAVEPVATVGVHCCADVDIASLLAAGPDVLSVPVHRVAGQRRRLPRAVPRERRPRRLGRRADRRPDPDEQRAVVAPAQRPVVRARRAAAAIPVLLRQRSLVTPHCGLGLHAPSVADRVVRLTREVGRRVNEQAVASRFALGA